jgi:hypothetical protein
MRCQATAKSTDQQCKRDGVPGAEVCETHGGKAPQVQKRARERLQGKTLEAADVLISILEDLYEEFQDAEEVYQKCHIARRIQALVSDILDRGGVPEVKRRELTGEEGDGISVERFVEVMREAQGG